MRNLSCILIGLVAACASTAKELPPPPPAEIAVAIASPAPGSELLAAEHATITVTGTITTTDPAQGALEAWVNGVRANITEGAFTAELTPEVGINHIKVEAGNGIGELVAQERDVMWAPAYLAPLAGETGFDLPGALELRLGQRFFDARLLGTALDRSTEPVVARDVAAALELVLWQVDLAGLLGGGLHVGQPGASLDVTILSATPQNIVVDARIADAPQPALDVTIDLDGVSLAMAGTASFGGRTLTIQGGLSADLRATARLTLGTADDGSIDVHATGITASVGPLVPGFDGVDGDELNVLLVIANSPFRALIQGLASSQLIPTFTDRLPPLLETLLGAADQLLDNINFTLDTGIGRPVTLQLDGRMGALEVVAGAASGHVTVRQDLTVRTTGEPIHAASRGAVRVDASTDAPVLSSAGMHLMMRQDFLNALLHALWNAGLLEGQLTVGGLTATVSAKLAPVIRATPPSSPCKIDGERCDVLLQLGQVEVALPTLGQRFAINASAGARIEVDGGTVSLKIQQMPELRVWELSAMPGTFTADNVRDLIATLVWPQLFGAIGNNLKIQLPLPDLAGLGLGDLAPGLANAQLQLQMRQRPSFAGGQIILGADLALSTPAP